jgi:protein-tyrosine phosphatase
LLLDGNFIAHRVAAHEAIRQAMRLMPGPLVAAPLCDSKSCDSKPGANTTPICQGDRVAAHCGAHVAAIVDDRTTHFGGLATAVRVDGNRCSVTTPGVLNGENLQRLGQLVVMLVCTGNTCRSPMAETLMRAGLKKRFTELFQNGNQPVFVTSAGLSAFPGGPASPEAITVMKSQGLSLLDHQSRAVTERGLRIADLVLTMTASHRSAIVDRFPDIADKVHLLSGSNEDLADPFGGSQAVYTACADQIQAYVARWISQFDTSWFPDWVFSAEN